MHPIIQELAERRRFGMKPGLDKIQRLLEQLDNPQHALAAVHIAGTNGKGCVAAICDSVLRAAGYPCGRYTSPHLNRINERFLVNGEPVSDEKLLLNAARVTEAIHAIERGNDLSITFFEAMTALALLLFKEEGLKLVVLETGLGGRLDATNVVDPLVSIITKIGLDHCEWLGSTLELIAAEKGGIIKPGRPVVVAPNSEDVQSVLAACASDCTAHLLLAEEQVAITRVSGSLVSQRLKISTAMRDLPPIDVRLAAKYHLENIATALCALELLHSLGVVLTDDAFITGLKQLSWKGRFQRVAVSPDVILDGAHNPDAALALRLALKQCGIKDNIVLISGFCGEKNALEFLKILQPVIRVGFAVTIDNPRSLAADDVANLMRCSGIAEVHAETSVRKALDQAIAIAGKIGGTVVVTGSLFLVAEILAFYEGVQSDGVKLNEGRL